jgi:thioredoxin:protein disulfide reductase
MKIILKRAAMMVASLALGACAFAQESSPVSITPEIQVASQQRELMLKIHVPEHHHLYAERLAVAIAGQSVKLALPDPVMQLDKYSGKTVGVYMQDFVASVPLASTSSALELAVDLQGCSDTECYFPETRKWSIRADQTVVSLDGSTSAASAPVEAEALTKGFKITQRASGYLAKKAFLSFLDSGSGASSSARSGSAFDGMGALATVLLILLGGLALNLTPCVLPMIPINLAILGAGVNGGNRRRGMALGGAYGLGMALAYGGLGLVVVLTGSRFGTLNSSAWFNFGIAIVFVVLGLAMFDKLAIDFSRFQRGGGGKKNVNVAFVGAALMGSVSALLAGACVAPVVISVLLLATTSYQQGKPLGLLYPFVLGLGMALPWPLAAGGLSFLPKPGRWMVRIKYGFGVLIFGFALWYGWLGWNLTRTGAVSVSARQTSDSVNDLRAALKRSRANGKPVFVDFWATWCKNCEAMEQTTFRDEEVRRRLQKFQVIHFEAERLDDPTIKLVLDDFGIVGLPSFIVMRPENQTRDK